MGRGMSQIGSTANIFRNRIVRCLTSMLNVLGATIGRRTEQTTKKRRKRQIKKRKVKRRIKMNGCIHNLNGYCKMFGRLEMCCYCSEYKEENSAEENTAESAAESAAEETNQTTANKEDKD